MNKKLELALHDFHAIKRMTVRQAAALARKCNVATAMAKDATQARDVGGLAHLIIAKEYGTTTQRAMFKALCKAQRRQI